MPCFYVPIVLVVDAAYEDVAASRADDILKSLIDLEPWGLRGNAVPDNLCVSLASPDWLDKDLTMNIIEGDKLIVIEE